MKKLLLALCIFSFGCRQRCICIGDISSSNPSDKFFAESICQEVSKNVSKEVPGFLLETHQYCVYDNNDQPQLGIFFYITAPNESKAFGYGNFDKTRIYSDATGDYDKIYFKLQEMGTQIDYDTMIKNGVPENLIRGMK